MREALILFASGLALAGCEFLSSVDDADRGWLTAAVRGTVAFDYEGTGEFYVGRDPFLEVPFVLTVTSRGNGESSGQELVLYGAVGIGHTGQYELTAFDGKAPQDAFTAQFYRQVGDTLEAYQSLSGELNITHSTEQRLAGGFHFTAVRYCASLDTGSELPLGSCDPRIIDPDAPKISLTGSFDAVPDTDEDVIELATQWESQ